MKRGGERRKREERIADNYLNDCVTGVRVKLKV